MPTAGRGGKELHYSIRRLCIGREGGNYSIPYSVYLSGGREGYRLAEDGYQLGGRRFLKTTSISPTGGIRRGANI